MNPLFPDWYRPIHLSPTPELLERRWNAAIRLLPKGSPFNACRDLLRLFIGIRAQNEQGFIDTLKSSDPTFPGKDNELEVRVLGGAALANKLAESDGAAIFVGYALITAEAVDEQVVEQHRDVQKQAAALLRELGFSKRACETPSSVEAKLSAVKWTAPKQLSEVQFQTVPNHQQIANVDQNFNLIKEAFSGLATSLSTLAQQVEGVRKASGTAIKELGALVPDPRVSILEEESNMLWWLFSEWSRDLEEPLCDLEAGVAAIIAGKELADLTKILPGHPAVRGFLQRAIAASRKDHAGAQVSIADAIDKTPIEWRRLWVGQRDIAQLRGLVPVLEGIRLSIDGGDWFSVFRARYPSLCTDEMAVADLAQRTFREALLLRSDEKSG
jgi:hypothetical protein